MEEYHSATYIGGTVELPSPELGVGSHTEGERWRFFSGEIGLRQDRAVELGRDNAGDDDHHEIAVRD